MYYFRYESGKAKVYKKSKEYGDIPICDFRFGIDAEEYVKIKNDQSKSKS
jgi:hypothetical protein